MSTSSASKATEEDAERQVVELLLSRTNTAIKAGDRDGALVNLLNAIALTKGPDAILQTLSDAKIRAQAGAEAMEVSRNRALLEEALRNSEMLVRGESILKDRSEEEILRDAFEDGSSVICVRCSSLIKQTRWEAHSTMWCPALASDEDGEV